MKQNEIQQYYDLQAENYKTMYERDNLYNLSLDYPANYFRLNQLINSFLNNNVKNVFEVGVGSGIPLLSLAKSGMSVMGCDISTEMVSAAKKVFSDNGLNEDLVFWGDIEDPTTYVHALKDGLFDGVLAMGVMPHVKNDFQVLKNIHAITKDDGTVFIEFRNKLFSLFTFNRYTKEFILEDLLSDISMEMRELVEQELDKHVDINLPKQRLIQNDGSVDYDAILSKFHIPFEAEELMKSCGYTDIKFHWYHYHAGMPKIQQLNEKLFREQSMALEYNKDAWKGMFLCSAFVIEAKVKK